MQEFFNSAEKTLNIEYNEQAKFAFDTYCSELLETNKVMNLTAITEPEQVYIKHFIDSSAILTAGDFDNATLIDVGCGAGFPGLPAKICNPSIKLTLLDSLGKRITFLTDLCKKMGLEDVRCMHARAEEEALKPEMREQFDFAVSRAVANLPVLCELCLPFVKVGGRFIAMKAEDYKEELKSAKNAISILGGKIIEEKLYQLPNGEPTRALIVIEKVKPTPALYPRRFAKIQKKPI